MALAVPAKVSRSPTRVLRQDVDGTRGQKTAKEDGGRSAPAPEPRAVLLPGYRVQLGADLLILCRGAGVPARWSPPSAHWARTQRR
jgi:hypothetical protein